nr:secretoglobin family 1D member 2-like [Mirounga angustirostris]
MRLFLSVLLVILALYCYEANAFACPALVDDLLSFLLQPAAIYKKTVRKFNASQEVIEAKLEVKSCTDKIFLGNRILIANTLLQKEYPAAIWKTPYRTPQLLQVNV